MNTTSEAIARFGEELVDDDRTTFTYEEAEALAVEVGHSVPTLVIRELKTYGFTQAARRPTVHVRGYTTSSHDRYFGPGCAKMHGGSGWEQISGLAGQEG